MEHLRVCFESRVASGCTTCLMKVLRLTEASQLKLDLPDQLRYAKYQVISVLSRFRSRIPIVPWKVSTMKNFSALVVLISISLGAGALDIRDAVVVVRPGELPNAEAAAATVLVEEFEKRTGIHLQISDQ